MIARAVAQTDRIPTVCWPTWQASGAWSADADAGSGRLTPEPVIGRDHLIGTASAERRPDA